MDEPAGTGRRQFLVAPEINRLPEKRNHFLALFTRFFGNFGEIVTGWSGEHPNGALYRAVRTACFAWVPNLGKFVLAAFPVDAVMWLQVLPSHRPTTAISQRVSTRAQAVPSLVRILTLWKKIL